MNPKHALAVVFVLLVQVLSYQAQATGAEVTYIEVDGPRYVDENSYAYYTCTAHYDDGTTQDVSYSAYWYEDSSYASIWYGRLDTTSVTSNQWCRITASYGGFSDYLDITIENVATVLTSIEVTGPSYVHENDTAYYTCTAHYDDGSTQDVSYSAYWYEDSSYASIWYGRLDTTAVTSNQWCRITASYGGFSDYLDITIEDTSKELVRIDVTGPTEVEPNSSANYTCTAYYDDGSTRDVTGSACWEVNSPYASIDSSGRLTTASAPSDTWIRVAATYSGLSDYLDVLIQGSTPVTVDHFVWNTIPSPQVANQSFPVTIVAKDASGSTVTTFTGPVQLSARPGSGELAIGSGTSSWSLPMGTYYHDARTQALYLASEIGGPCTINGLALYVTTVPGQTMRNWTIRMRHTTLSSYPATPTWEGTGWTTVHRSTASVASTGWVTFAFSTPFAYNGANNLMVDFSYNGSTRTSDGLCRTTATGQTRSIYCRTNSQWGDPLAWSGTSRPTPLKAAWIPNVKLVTQATVAITPAASGLFTNGVWAGNVTVWGAASGVRLRADDASGHVGYSNSFDVTAPPLPSPPTGVRASDGTYPDKVRVTWTASPAAASYQVWRSTSSDRSTATRIASSVTGTGYDDTGAPPGTTHWYWLTATNTNGTSGFSESDSGYRASVAVAIKITSCPTLVSRAKAIAASWTITGGTPTSHNSVEWWTSYDSTVRSTLQDLSAPYAASFMAPWWPCTVYLRAHAIVNGKSCYSQRKQITVR